MRVRVCEFSILNQDGETFRIHDRTEWARFADDFVDVGTQIAADSGNQTTVWLNEFVPSRSNEEVAWKVRIVKAVTPPCAKKRWREKGERATVFVDHAPKSFQQFDISSLTQPGQCLTQLPQGTTTMNLWITSRTAPTAQQKMPSYWNFGFNEPLGTFSCGQPVGTPKGQSARNAWNNDNVAKIPDFETNTHAEVFSVYVTFWDNAGMTTARTRFINCQCGGATSTCQCSCPFGTASPWSDDMVGAFLNSAPSSSTDFATNVPVFTDIWNAATPPAPINSQCQLISKVDDTGSVSNNLFVMSSGNLLVSFSVGTNGLVVATLKGCESPPP